MTWLRKDYIPHEVASEAQLVRALTQYNDSKSPGVPNLVPVGLAHASGKVHQRPADGQWLPLDNVGFPHTIMLAAIVQMKYS